MRQFIVFYSVNLAGKLSPAMGSDGVLPLDGRIGKPRAFAAAREQAHRLRHVKPGIIAFELRHGNYRNSRPDGHIHPLNCGLIGLVNEAKAKGIVPW